MRRWQPRDWVQPRSVSDYPPSRSVHARLSLARLGVAVTLGAATGVVAAVTAPWQTVPLLAWSATAMTYVASVWLKIARLDPVATSAVATAEDPRRATADLLLLVASVISLAAVIVGIIKAGSSHGAERAVLLAAGIATIVVSWGVVHTIFTLRYAALYYSGGDGGIDFHDDAAKPSYVDFAYMAFTIAMTYQVSDTDITTKEIRHTALRHALLSYVFGTVIIAATINLAAGLAK